MDCAMAMRFRRWCLAALLLPCLAVAAAPEFALPDVAGKTHRVGEYLGQGQWTVVAVWSVDCVICRRELPELAFFRDARVLGIAIDGVEERERIKAFVRELGLGFPSLIGVRDDVARLGASK